ncbi:hypothetical protein CISIN_1g0358471mg, partial [Citrus sinensis]
WVIKNVTLLLQSMDLTNPDECTVTYALIFQRCPKLNNLELGIQVHAHLIVCGVELCAFLGMFEKMPERNVFSWTSMMGMYNVLGYYEEIVNLFYLLIDEGVYKACSELKDHRVGKDVYDYMISIKFEGNACVKRPVLDMFIKCGRMEMASGEFEEKDFSNLSLLKHGKEIHPHHLKKDDLESDLLVNNSLMDFYAKCRYLKVAHCKFSKIKQKHLVSWNAMLAGYALGGFREEITGFTQYGDGETALEFFSRMIQTDMQPNTISLSGVLAACAQVKGFKLGKEIHGYVLRHHIQLSTGVGIALISIQGLGTGSFVWNSLIDMYGRCGAIQK